MRNWPKTEPTTYADWCLNRIATALERLVELNAPSAPPDVTELAEDFPGREALAEAGILYYETLPRTGAELAAVGLDGRTANRVLSWIRAAQ